MRFDDCASIVQKRKGTGDDAIDFSYKRIFATPFLSENWMQMNVDTLN